MNMDIQSPIQKPVVRSKIVYLISMMLIVSCKDENLESKNNNGVLVRIFVQYIFAPNAAPQKIEINIAENTKDKEAKLIAKREITNCNTKNCLNQISYLQSRKHYFLAKEHSINQQAGVNEITSQAIRGEFFSTKDYFYFDFRLPVKFKGDVRAFRLVQIGDTEIEVRGFQASLLDAASIQKTATNCIEIFIGKDNLGYLGSRAFSGISESARCNFANPSKVFKDVGGA